jgi:thiol-disulfide isomerase/thioredoxin
MNYRFGRVLSSVLMTAAVLFAAAGMAPTAMADDIKREGEGKRRESLDAMELKPFDASLLSKITDWNSPAAASEITGKVVVLCMWADWYPPCKRVMTQCQKIAEKFGKDGVVVVAVHNSRGWDASKNSKFNKDAPVYSGVDASGDFRKAIMSDQDPDVYVIDRAGQMRFADVDKGSLEAAVQLLVKESATDAGSINSNIAAQKQKADADLRRSEAINQNIDLTALPELDFPAPAPDAYKKAKWPKMPVDRIGRDYIQNGFETKADPNKKEEEKPPQQFLTPDAQFLGGKPPMAGRVRLFYFWHPDSRFSFGGLPDFELIQRQRPRDLVVIGAISKLKDAASAGGGGTEKEVEMDPIKIKKRIDEFLATRKFGTSIFFDATGALLGTALDKDAGGGTPNEIPIPLVAIVSSDGILRWAGAKWLPSYQAALEQIIAEDPAVQARRKVEADFIRSKGK